MEAARVPRFWGHSEGREVCLGRWGSAEDEDPAQTLSLPTALGEVLVQQVAAGLQNERDRDDRHFPEKIRQLGRLPFSCDPPPTPPRRPGRSGFHELLAVIH